MSDDRLDKIDDAIQRLAVVAGDLSKMLAVHEHRISFQERTSENIVASMEKRRAEIDSVLKDVYTTMRDEINMLRKAGVEQHTDQNKKIESIQRTMWIGVGAVIIASWAIPLFLNKILH